MLCDLDDLIKPLLDHFTEQIKQGVTTFMESGSKMVGGLPEGEQLLGGLEPDKATLPQIMTQYASQKKSEKIEKDFPPKMRSQIETMTKDFLPKCREPPATCVGTEAINMFFHWFECFQSKQLC